MIKNQGLLLGIICLIVLSLHVGLIYILQGAEMTFYAPQRTGFLNADGHGVSSSEDDRAKESERRNQELADVFRTLTPDKALDEPSDQFPHTPTQTELSGLHEAWERALGQPLAQHFLPAAVPQERVTLAEYRDGALPNHPNEFLADREVELAPIHTVKNEDIARQVMRQTAKELEHLSASSRASKELLITTSGDDSIAALTIPEPSTALSAVDSTGRGSAEPMPIAQAHQENILANLLTLPPEAALLGLPVDELFPAATGQRAETTQFGAGSEPMPNLARGQDFIIDLKYAPKRDGNGYVFRLAFIPKPDVAFKRIRQNIFFLIDRSNSIDVKRYEQAKDGVAQVLTLMHPGDTFNILLFDSKIESLSERSVPWTKENLERAYTFLEQQPHGGRYATTDIYSCLGKIVPSRATDTEVNTAVLISDGDPFLKPSRQRQMISRWTQQNSGKVSLYCISASDDDNLPLLEVLSAFNRGALLYATSTDQTAALLTRLVKGIRSPIGKDIVATVVSSNPDAVITLYPHSEQLPNLYQNLPYVLYGTTNTLTDFTLFLQGKHYEREIDIKQKVSFKTAKTGDLSIEQHCALYAAHTHYQRYLSDGKSKHLKAAKLLLNPLHIEPAFE